MYKTISFSSGSFTYDVFDKYKEWLENKQKQQRIAIIDVTALNHLLIVTYKEN